jgi:hypothetical protein
MDLKKNQNLSIKSLIQTIKEKKGSNNNFYFNSKESKEKKVKDENNFDFSVV